MKILLGCVLLVVSIAASSAMACGACIEDKVAATYDHAVIERATSKGNVVVFCELKGRIDPSRLKEATRHMMGVDTTSVRVAQAPPALSFALDAARQSPENVVVALRHMFPDIRITIIREIASSPTPSP